MPGVLRPPGSGVASQMRRELVWTPTSPDTVRRRYLGDTGTTNYLRVWLWNVSNVHDVRRGAPPLMEEVGPYAFQLWHEKLAPMWRDDGRVRFKSWTHYQPLPELTPAHLNATIVTWNLPLLGVLAKVHASTNDTWHPFLDLLASLVERYKADNSSEGVFTVRTASELLMGYDDPLLSALAALLPRGMLPTTRVSFLPDNVTREAALLSPPTVANTGLFNLSELWNLEEDHGVKAITSWPCGPEPVAGTDGTQFPPAVAPGTALRVWLGDALMSVLVEPQGEVQLHGIRLLRYGLGASALAPNPCHDMQLAGLFNITGPRAAGPGGAPGTTGPLILVSQAHFCGADPALAAGVRGVACDPSRHEVYLDVEPITGATMRGAKRVQLSSQVGAMGSTLDPRVAPNLTIPMFWLEEASELTAQQAAAFKASVYTAQWIIHNGHTWGCIIGGVLLGIALLLAVLVVEWSAARHRDLRASSVVQHARAVLDRAQATQPDAPGSISADAEVESHPLLGGSGASTDF